MKPAGVTQLGEEAVLHMAPDDPEGGFFDAWTMRSASVGRVALIFGIPASHVHEIYDGNTELLDNYVIQKENQPGVYHLVDGATATLINNEAIGSWAPENHTKFQEFTSYRKPLKYPQILGPMGSDHLDL